MPNANLVSELASRLVGIAIVSSDITENDMRGRDMESVIAYVTNYFEKSEKPAILTRELLIRIMSESSETVAETKVEIIRPLDFKPVAKDVKDNFVVRNVGIEKTDGKVVDFAEHFNDRLAKLKQIIYEGQNNKMAGMTYSIESVKQYANGREVAIIGMVYDKAITKNGHVLVTIEDETGTAKVLFPKATKEMQSVAANELFASATKIIDDEVIAVRGKIAGTGPFIIANAMVYPDVPVHQMKKTEDDIAVAFMSDVHVGSKLFMQKHFDRFIEWMNGKHEYRRGIAEKVKYIVVSGDLVDGIGVYPNQDKELAIDDIYMQYKELFTLFAKIPEYVQIFLITGNHDAVQRAEPQPQLPQEFYKDFKLSNIHLVSNPGYVTLNGIRVLGYHGTSLDSVIQGVPGCSYSRPEGAMLEVLKRRHLSPIYGHNPIVPSKNDTMLIDQVPDILHMGHLHKNGYSEYHGTLIVNSGTWQSRTSFQVRQGHMPTPALLPVYETNKQAMSSVDFNNSVD